MADTYVVPLTGEIVPNDVAALAVPGEVTVPATVDDAALVLDSVGGLLTASQWATAAIVHAWVDEPGQGRRTDLVRKEVMP